MFEYQLAMEVDLQLFAKDGPTGEKSEKPTAKKIKDSRDEGQVAKSQELNTAVMLLGLFLLLKVTIGFIGENMMEAFPEFINKIPSYVFSNIEIVAYGQLLFDAVILVFKVAWPVFVMGIAVSFLSNCLQFKWHVTMKPMKPKLSKISPISGIKRMFSIQTLVKTIISIAKVILIVYVVYNTVKNKWELLFNVYDMPLLQVIAQVGDIAISLGIKIAMIMLVIGLADFIFQKWKNMQDMMMSKQDVKDEYKNQEGDPLIKSKIKQKQREVSQRRMMESVPKADVIITNPTHYAVAIRYDTELAGAPVVVAKGTDYLAQKIKDLAKDSNVEIVENRALARMLYNNVEIDQEIPPELYQAVAEVLAYVYKLRNSA